MTNTPDKFQITMADTTTIKSKQLNYSWPSGKNGYRVDTLFVKIPALDALATGDYVLFQFSYEDQNGIAFASVNGIHNKNVIKNVGISVVFTANDGISDLDKIRNIGIEFAVNRFIVEEEAFLNMIIAGQDGAISAECEIQGQYVKLKPDDYKKLQRAESR